FAQAGDAGEAVAQFEYGTESGTPVTSIDVDMAGRNVTWTWNAEEGLFYRAVNGSPHNTTTGEFNTNNVIVLLVAYGRSSDGNPEPQTVGTGDVDVYAGGKKTVGTWTREDDTQPFSLTDEPGAPILLRAGRTVVELAEAGASLSDDAG